MRAGETTMSEDIEQYRMELHNVAWEPLSHLLSMEGIFRAAVLPSRDVSRFKLECY